MLCSLMIIFILVSSSLLELLHLMFFFSILQQIGPDVSISANVRVAAGVRLINCIILDDVEIKVWFFNNNP